MKIVIFTGVKNRCMMHGRVFVMCLTKSTKSHVNPEKNEKRPGCQFLSQSDRVFCYADDIGRERL